MSSITSKLRENLTAQTYELEALQSVYPKELSVAYQGILADINNFVTGESEEIPQRLEYSIDVSLPQVAVRSE